MNATDLYMYFIENIITQYKNKYLFVAGHLINTMLKSYIQKIQIILQNVKTIVYQNIEMNNY